jgi:hypothetical protein
MFLSPIRDAELGPPSLVILRFDGFFHDLCPAFQGVEGDMGFIALLAKLFLKFVKMITGITKPVARSSLIGRKWFLHI